MSSSAAGKAAKAIADLASKLRPTWTNGKWREPAISARRRAKLRRETLLNGEEWPYDPPRKEHRPKMQGHKHDKETAERHVRIAENMAKMPQLLEEMKRRKKEAKK